MSLLDGKENKEKRKFETKLQNGILKLTKITSVLAVFVTVTAVMLKLAIVGLIIAVIWNFGDILTALKGLAN